MLRAWSDNHLLPRNIFSDFLVLVRDDDANVVFVRFGPCGPCLAMDHGLMSLHGLVRCSFFSGIIGSSAGES